jgi:hypothetical protein
LERLATTAAGFLDVFEFFETLELFDPGRRAALNVVCDVELELALAVLTAGVLPVDARCETDGLDADALDAAACATDGFATDGFAADVLGPVALDGFDAARRCEDLRCNAVFEAGGFAAGVFDGASCATRFPAARRANVITTFETRKSSV